MFESVYSMSLTFIAFPLVTLAVAELTVWLVGSKAEKNISK